MSVPLPFLVLAAALAAAPPIEAGPLAVRIPVNAADEIDVAEIVSRLADATGTDVRRPSGGLELSRTGLPGSLTRKMLAEQLGPGVRLRDEPRALVLTLDERPAGEGARAEWRKRLEGLSAWTQQEIDRRARYGMHALESYRPNDRTRPTVCLVHGVNSTSSVFVHMIPTLEKAGFGVVVYDYPYNRDLEKSCESFARDWEAFRREKRETRPWAILAHSMGSLLARSYVEDPKDYRGDVSSLILIGPVNQGSTMAKAQVVVQLLRGLEAINGKQEAGALAHLGDGLGEAAEDMLPGSKFLEALNRRPRRAGVAYHVLAGDAGYLPRDFRRRIDERRVPLSLRVLLRLLPGDLDEYTEGTGDGCVSVARTRLAGVDDHVTIHANHAELIRAPLFYPDPGPVACMPYVLRWLGAPGRAAPGGGPQGEARPRR